MPSTYRFSGFAFARASTLDRPWPRPAFDFTDHDAILLHAGTRWLRQLWAREDIREALTVASRALAERIAEVLNDPSTDAGQLRSLLRSAYTYLLRWERRSTPFGLFAGVAPVTTGPETKARIGIGLRVWNHIDTQTLHTRAIAAESDPDTLRGLRVVTNQLATVRGNRLAIPSPATQKQLAAGAIVETSVRATAPVRAALEEASEPVTFSDLADRISQRFPKSQRARVSGMLTELVRAGALVSDAHLPMSALSTGQAKPVDAQEPTAVHVSLDAEFHLAQKVMNEAEHAADTLIRLSASPYGPPSWREYLQRFLESYGPGAMVPVRELVSDAGLGYPTGYLGAACAKGPRPLTDRDAIAIELVQQAVLDGAEEIAFTKTVIDQLRVGDGTDRVLPPRVELKFRIDAASPEAVDAGRFRLWITGIPRPESSLAGRFLPFLGIEATNRYTTSYAPAPGRVYAQLSFPPRKPRNGNVAAVSALLPAVIPLGEHPPADGREVISLDDLAVTASPTGLHLIRVSTGEVVEAHALHALDPTVHTPPLARFLSEVSGAGRSLWGPVDLGIARTLPYLPRLRAGRTVLAPARWLLRAADLPDANAAATEWDRAFAKLRERLRMPETIEFTTGDSRLPLDVTDRLDRYLLRIQLHKAGELEVAEREPNPSWPGRACEFVTALNAKTAPPQPHHAPVPAAPLEVPAGGMIAATLHAHPRRIDQIVTEYLPALFSKVKTLSESHWYTRFHDAARPEFGHRLQIRMRGRNGADVLAVLRQWAAEIHESGLAADFDLTGYRHHAGRWGTDPGPAEHVLSADSQAAIAELAEAIDTTQTDAMTACSMVDLAAGLAPAPVEGWQWLTDVLPHEEVRVDPRTRKSAFAMSNAPHAQAAAITTAWDHRRSALAAYRQALTDERSPRDTLRSLLHENVIRRTGVDAERERALIRLARSIATRNLHMGGIA